MTVDDSRIVQLQSLLTDARALAAELVGELSDVPFYRASMIECHLDTALNHTQQLARKLA